MTKSGIFFIILALGSIVPSQATHAVTIDTVVVGNPGNPPNTGVLGSVAKVFRIAKFEVTKGQYAEFLNAKAALGDPLELYNFAMNPIFTELQGGITRTGSGIPADPFVYIAEPGRQNMPVVHVSWYDAIRFANWVHNGQGNGDTETGAYTLLGGTPTPSNGGSITRNAAATWFLPTRDEWLKAAFHKNDGVTANYWTFPFGTDAIPYSDQPPGNDAPDSSNTANFFKDDSTANGYDDGFAVSGSPTIESTQIYLTDVGSYLFSAGPYGTFDQGGNVREWLENSTPNPSQRGIIGGSWNDGPFDMNFSGGSGGHAGLEISVIGFRVATVPEPTSVLLAALSLVALVAFSRRILAVAVP